MLVERKFGRGDIVWLDFTPTKGHEQSGKRPALVISPKEYNAKSGLMLVCPITSKRKGYPFEVTISGKIKGAILADQIRSVDWRARNANKADTLTNNKLREVRELISLLG